LRQQITGARRLGFIRNAGYGKVHVAVVDVIQLAYREVLPDQKQATAMGALHRHVAWLNAQAIT